MTIKNVSQCSSYDMDRKQIFAVVKLVKKKKILFLFAINLQMVQGAKSM